ncbi:hypothetical protein D3C80_1843040 [compost metagenome]
MYRRQLTIEQRKQYAFLDSKIASMEYDKLRVIEICEAKLKQVNLMDVVSTMIVVVQVCFFACAPLTHTSHSLTNQRNTLSACVLFCC